MKMHVTRNIYIKINQVPVNCLKESTKSYPILKALSYMYFNFNFFNVENLDCAHVNNNSMLHLHHVSHETHLSSHPVPLLRTVALQQTGSQRVCEITNIYQGIQVRSEKKVSQCFIEELYSSHITIISRKKAWISGWFNFVFINATISKSHTWNRQMSPPYQEACDM